MREDEQLRSVSFFASNYNCCEMFYKMKKGIECKENEVELNTKASSGVKIDFGHESVEML